MTPEQLAQAEQWREECVKCGHKRTICCSDSTSIAADGHTVVHLNGQCEDCCDGRLHRFTPEQEDSKF